MEKETKREKMKTTLKNTGSVPCSLCSRKKYDKNAPVNTGMELNDEIRLINVN